MHLRSNGDHETQVQLGPFRADIGWTTAGQPAWVRVYDDPRDPSPAATPMDPGWAEADEIIEFRLRHPSRAGEGRVDARTLGSPDGAGLVIVGWEETDGAARLCALGLAGAFASDDLNPTT